MTLQGWANLIIILALVSLATWLLYRLLLVFGRAVQSSWKWHVYKRNENGSPGDDSWWPR
jgi:flagellar biogenesis protein FliO